MTSEIENIHRIIDGCKKNNLKSQEQLYRNFYRVMMLLCLRYTKNEKDAMEVLNTGFYKVYKNIDRYNPSVASLYTWIRTIIINSCLDFIKVKDKQLVPEELNQAIAVDLPPDVFIKMSAKEILQLVRQLPTATQAVFNLFVIEGYSHKEISELMSISEGTSKWYLSEARKILKQLINKRENG